MTVTLCINYDVTWILMCRVTRYPSWCESLTQFTESGKVFRGSDTKVYYIVSVSYEVVVKFLKVVTSLTYCFVCQPIPCLKYVPHNESFVCGCNLFLHLFACETYPEHCRTLYPGVSDLHCWEIQDNGDGVNARRWLVVFSTWCIPSSEVESSRKRPTWRH